ncbi:MAG: winged helix-turn-helix domain-containing protein [Rhodospirillales bacterium]|nr:winged helix-turn-helix domain-containing protein [Rhodospirillales bacterium]
MSERQIIKGRILKKEHEIQVLEEKLKAARIYVQALQDVLKVIGGEPDKASPSESGLRSGSSVDRARAAILSNLEPMHINDLLEVLGMDQSRESRASLTSSLSAYVRRNEIFTRPAPSTFGLVELGHHTIDEGPVDPPQGFGEKQKLQPSPGDDADEVPF